ncbi:glycosyltransferase [uncultured Piscinibacter sp.]|uniref:glycosyltransferase n=1 Tax=uncultured Piscinibacter sp. TaxID=1131835 RepID=UPI0026240D51|nr:glycosyltransferase [uncultured Piscinibacter sp.]
MSSLTTAPRRRLLMIAYHFPPLAGSSGIQRTLRFVQHLPAHGWDPIVLTAHPRVYPTTSPDLLAEVPPSVPVQAAFALDSSRHLAFGGRYPGFLARPDRWMSWWWGAVPAGLRLIRQHRPDAIWSTYPIATAHRIGHTLHRLSGLPWIADFRDPMAQHGYPEDPKVWRSFARIERDIAASTARMVFVTPSALRMYRERFAELPAERFALIENGYDEESFLAAEELDDRRALISGHFTLLHSGIVYPSERDPTALMDALSLLRNAGHPRLESLRIRFRAAVHDDLLRRLAGERGVADLIDIQPAVPYRQALHEMLRADGLLVMQGTNCNEQVPAKLYEYLRAGRPILGLADPAGDTAQVMADAGVTHVAKLESVTSVAAALAAFLDDTLPGSFADRTNPRVRAMSRAERARSLANLLDRTVAESAQGPERQPRINHR